MPATDAAANTALDALMSPAGQVGLLTTLPDASGAGAVEPSGGGYARVAVAAGGWPAATGRSTTLPAAVTFPAPTGDWGVARGWGWFVDGALQVWEPLAEPVNVPTGADPVRLPAGTLTVEA